MMRKGAACMKSLKNLSALLDTEHQSFQLLPISGHAHIHMMHAVASS